MAVENESYLILAGVAVGAIGGLLLGNYIWGSKEGKRSLSKHVATLGNILEQVENLNSEESENLKERIENILKTIESNYGISEE
jgi:uncharacterized membrane protein YgaE (UPF0421/DUF939 family)